MCLFKYRYTGGEYEMYHFQKFRPTYVTEMLRCPCLEDKQLSFGLKIHSLTEFKPAKKRCDSDNAKHSKSPDFIEDIESKRIVNLYAVASV